MLEKQTIEIDGKHFILSKFPAIAGREIITQYPLSGIPKLGDYKTNETIMLKIMAFVAVPLPELELRLTTQALIDNHVGSWETLMKLEMAMMEYNCSFFRNGGISNLFETFAEMLPAWITKMLTALSEQSLPTEKPRSKSLKTTTR